MSQLSSVCIPCAAATGETIAPSTGRVVSARSYGWKVIASLCRVDQAYLLDLVWCDLMREVNRDRLDALVGPGQSIIYIRGSLHVAIGEMDFDIQVVFSRRVDHRFQW